MKISLFAAIAATLALAAAGTQAATLVDWNLDTVTGPTDNNTPFDGVASSVATVAANISVTNLVTASSSGHAGLVWSSGNAGPGKLNLQRWDHPNDSPSSFGNGNGNPNNWLQFSIIAETGYWFDLTSMTISAWRNGAGAAADWSYEYSTDSGTNWTAFGSVHNESNAGDSIFRDVTFTGSVTEVEELLIRFIAVGPDGGTGNIHINEMTVSGDVRLIPEPSGALLAFLGLLPFLRRRRSH